MEDVLAHSEASGTGQHGTMPPDASTSTSMLASDNQPEAAITGLRDGTANPSQRMPSAGSGLPPRSPILPPSPRLSPTSPQRAGIAAASTISSLAASPSLGSSKAGISGVSPAVVPALLALDMEAGPSSERPPSVLSLEDTHERPGSIGSIARLLTPVRVSSSVNENRPPIDTTQAAQTSLQPIAQGRIEGDAIQQPDSRTRSSTSSTHSDVGLPETDERFPILQMLSMVGSRFVEADADGIAASDGEVEQRLASRNLQRASAYGAQSDAEESNDDEHRTRASAPGPSQPSSASEEALRRRWKRQVGSRSEIWDDTCELLCRRPPLYLVLT